MTGIVDIFYQSFFLDQFQFEWLWGAELALCVCLSCKMYANDLVGLHADVCGCETVDMTWEFSVLIKGLFGGFHLGVQVVIWIPH
jgi:hypothetical protein